MLFANVVVVGALSLFASGLAVPVNQSSPVLFSGPGPVIPESTLDSVAATALIEAYPDACMQDPHGAACSAWTTEIYKHGLVQNVTDMWEDNPDSVAPSMMQGSTDISAATNGGFPYVRCAGDPYLVQMFKECHMNGYSAAQADYVVNYIWYVHCCTGMKGVCAIPTTVNTMCTSGEGGFRVTLDRYGWKRIGA